MSYAAVSWGHMRDFSEGRVRNVYAYSLVIWTILMAALVLGWAMNSSMLKLICILAATALYAWSGAEIKFYMLLFCIPYISIIRVGSESFSTLNVWIMLLLLNLMLYKPKIHSFLLALLLSFISVLTMNLGKMGIAAYIGLLLDILVVFFTCATKYPEGRFSFSVHRATLFISIGFLLSSAAGLLLRILLPQTDSLYKVMSAVPGNLSIGVARFTGLMRDPNYFAQGVIICIASLLYVMLMRQNTSLAGTLGLSAILLPLIYFGWYSYSKMFLLAFGFLTAFFVVYLLFQQKIKMSFKLVAAAMLILIAFYSVSSVSIILNRFQDGSDFSTGRVNIVQETIQTVASEPGVLVIGVGVGQSIVSYFGTALHNLYLEYVLSFGLIGTLLWLGVLIGAKHYTLWNKPPQQKALFRYAPLTMILLTGFALDGVWADWHYFYLILAIKCINMEV